MIDAFGQLVASRENATACGLCPPGTFASSISDEYGQSSVCLKCEPGFYQGGVGWESRDYLDSFNDIFRVFPPAQCSSHL